MCTAEREARAPGGDMARGAVSSKPPERLAVNTAFDVLPSMGKGKIKK